jgi:diacylglycerol kinase (ATP)
MSKKYMRKIAFVINPKAGKKKNLNLTDFIQKNISNQINYEILVWDPVEQFESIKQHYLNNDFDVVVACGGDGTVNAVATSLAHSNIALGILPLGSGNGLARSLGYPMVLQDALKFVCEEKIISIDGNNINGYMSFCAGGIGFDAHVSNLFASSETRGLKTYISISMKAYFNYPNKQYKIDVDGTTLHEDAFLITLANAPQYGNNAYIAPDADMQDGLAEVVLLKKFPLVYAPIAAIRLFNKSIYKSKYIKKISGKNISVQLESNDTAIHADGEPYLSPTPIVIKVVPKCLKVVSSL